MTSVPKPGSLLGSNKPQEMLSQINSLIIAQIGIMPHTLDGRMEAEDLPVTP